MKKNWIYTSKMTAVYIQSSIHKTVKEYARKRIKYNTLVPSVLSIHNSTVKGLSEF